MAASRSSAAHPVAARFLAGGANGLLPCGLVYAAAIAAAGLGTVSGAVVFMTGFGLGTMPMLIVMR